MKITKAEKLEYLEEMITPYVKNGQKKCFIDQFFRGAGNELLDKFWELKSSSRMAYDLFSWMKDCDDIIDFEFEYLLPNLKSGGTGPNMDVFIETRDELIFVESKFTERANLHYIDDGYLKEAYYADKPYGRWKMNLETRFYGNNWAKSFSSFCEDWEEVMKANNWHHGTDWFEPKQETCHISGILLYLFDQKNRKQIKNKKIRLYNIYWKMPGDMDSAIEKLFCAKAQTLICNIIESHNPGIVDFKISAFSVQDMLSENRLSDLIKFPEGKLEEITSRNENILNTLKIKSR
jgi:hypothetical protein